MRNRLIVLVSMLAGLAAAERPNFLFILVDDLGCRDLGYEGSTFHETPNIDALAASGMRFNQGYAACSVCSPSRASIMTGKATPRHGITDWIGSESGMDWDRDDQVLPAEYVWNLPKEEITIAEAMRDAGYETFFAGKWHLGTKGSWPEDHGFMTNIGGWDKGSPRRHYFSPYKNPALEDGPAGESLTERLARETAEFIESRPDKPFFAFLSFYAVHGRIQTTEELCRKYQKKAAAMGLTENDTRFKFDRRLPVRQVQDNPIYAGLVESMDSAVGLVMNTLKKTGLDKNTVVIFTSDNGGVSSGDSYSTSLLPFRGGKGRQWEGGIREPYLIYVPGMTHEGEVSEEPVIGMDFYPTILELAGLPLMPEQHVDGVSLVPLLKGESIADRDLFWHYPHYGNQGGEPSSIIRSRDWKLIYYHEDGRCELYNLKNDIGEQTDLAAQQPERVALFQKKLNEWLAETGAKFPARDPRFTQEAFDAKIETARTSFMQGLEKEHAACLDENWAPDEGPLPWWGSKGK
ncbi:sulfatase [Pontiella agarivorans]|uniref:Sulfatase n=1 Tax=Pontiella agarivorans TaxID=3038953 RepID=A0ABU5MS57_9BACT|nr:sulfatase [Pontiella agarivorans]MDZ8117035.1 sulfatase [Pontiella agarivorans]